MTILTKIFLASILLLIINFLGAKLLKNGLKNTVREHKWLKYLFVIPPLALIGLLLLLIHFTIEITISVIREYFKD